METTALAAGAPKRAFGIALGSWRVVGMQSPFATSYPLVNATSESLPPASLDARVRAITRPAPALFWYSVLVSLGALCAAPLVMVPMLFKYYSLWYRFDEAGVAMGYGFLFRRERRLTYQKMQDIQVSQNLLERWLGIGTVTIQTAGSALASDVRIVGVGAFESIRDYLYQRMRGVGEVQEVRPPASTAILEGIRDALQETAALLRGK